MNTDTPSSSPPPMDEGLTIRGSLRESGVPELIKSFLINRETGVLTLTLEEVAKSLYFREGKLLWASSNDPDDRLGECMLREGKITVEQLQESAQHIRPGRRQGTILIELGYISPEDLVRAVTLQVEEILDSIFSWSTGDYQMLLSNVDSHEFMTLNLASENLIYQATRKVRSWSRILRGLGSMEAVPARAEGSEMLIYRVDLTEDEQHIWGMANGKISVSQICAMSYMSNFETCRALWGLLTIGALSLASAKDAESAFREQVAEYESMELREEIERLNQLLAALAASLRTRLDAGVSAFLASSLSKVEERFPEALRGAVFQADGTIDTDLLAGNLMAAETDDRRGMWKEASDELLYAILLQARLRFGKDVEAELSALVEAMRGTERPGGE